MYRRKIENLPRDPLYPHDLAKLGYKLDSNDCITSLKDPGEYFQFWITNSQRYNGVQREAMHDCARRLITQRLTSFSLPPLYLPTLTAKIPPKPTPFLPIHVTPLPLLLQKKHIVVIINRSREDLAILSYRILSRAGGLTGGSALCIIQEIQNRAAAAAAANGTTKEEEEPGIVILNTGQLLFSHKQRKAVTPTTWDAMPRRSAVHPAPRVHEVYNKIGGNGSFEEHIRFVFERLLGNDEYVHKDAQLYILGLCEGGDEILRYLSSIRNFSPRHQRHRVAALALTNPVPVYAGTSAIPLTDNDDMLRFLGERTRAWRLSRFELNTPEANPTELARLKDMAARKDDAGTEVDLWPAVSGGEKENEECIAATAFRAMLDWFESVRMGGGAGGETEAGGSGHGKGNPGYKNGALRIREEIKAVLAGLEVEGVGW